MTVTLTFAPLDRWPWPLTTDRQRATFKVGLDATTAELIYELDRIDTTRARLCLALNRGAILRDGSRPYAHAIPDHPGVMVLADTPAGSLRWATDRYDHWHDNLRAIRLGVEALRAVDRYGITRAGEQYRGFAALPAPSSSGSTHLTMDDALRLLIEWTGWSPAAVGDSPEAAVRLARRRLHPDVNGGDHGPWDRLLAVAATIGVEL